MATDGNTTPTSMCTPTLSKRVRLFVFDFDQTLSVYHVFKSLAGWPGQDPKFVVPPPHASSELGQALRVEELSAREFREAGGFAAAAFGGPKRVAEVREMLKGLEVQGVEAVVCTKGLVGAVKKCLSDLELLSHFREVYGRTGDKYGITDYDRKAAAKVTETQMKPDGEKDSAHMQLLELIGQAQQDGWSTKEGLVASLMQQRGLQRHEAILVEDDPNETRAAAKVCRTMLVRAARGMTSQDMAKILELAQGEDDSRSATDDLQPGQQRSRCMLM